MENNRDLLEEDIEMLTIKELKEYSMEEILRTLKYLYKKNENISTQWYAGASSYWPMRADKFSEILQASC